MNVEGASNRMNVFIGCADGNAGVDCARELLKGHGKEHIHKVYAGVCHGDSKMHDRLRDLGCELVKLDFDRLEKRELCEKMRHCQVFVMIPEPMAMPEKNFKQNCCKMIEAAHEANIKAIVMASKIGCDHAKKNEHHHFHQLHELEQHVKETKFEHGHCILRTGCPYEGLFYFADMVQKEHRLMMPMHEDRKFAMVDMRDIGACLARCVCFGKDPKQLLGEMRNQCYVLAPESYSGKEIAHMMKKNIGTEVEYRKWDAKDMCHYLEKQKIPALMRHFMMEGFCLTEEGKMDVTSRDVERLLGEKPMSVDRFLKDNANRFK